jgi:hypothetical protein
MTLDETTQGRYLTNKQASQEYNLSDVTLWRARKDGSLAFYRIGAKVLYARHDLELFFETRRRNGNAALWLKTSQGETISNVA